MPGCKIKIWKNMGPLNFLHFSVMFPSPPGCSPPGYRPTPPRCGATVARSISLWATATPSDWLQTKTLWSGASDRCGNHGLPPEGAIPKRFILDACVHVGFSLKSTCCQWAHQFLGLGCLQRLFTFMKEEEPSELFPLEPFVIHHSWHVIVGGSRKGILLSIPVIQL